MITYGTLGNLTFMMGKLQIHAAAMDIEFFSQVFTTHGRTLNMPARKAFTPGALPAHDMLGGCFFPECEITFISFLILVIECPGRFQLIF